LDARGVVLVLGAALASGCASESVERAPVRRSTETPASRPTKAPEPASDLIRIIGVRQEPLPEPPAPVVSVSETRVVEPPRELLAVAEPRPVVGSLAELARAFEDAGKDEDACDAYRLLASALSATPIPVDADTGALRAFTREARVRRALGKYEWTVARSRHFIVFTESRAAGVDLDAFERARFEALARLGLDESRVPRSECVPVFVFEDQCGFIEVAGTESWASGCAAYCPIDGETSRAIYLVREPAIRIENTVQHEIAHVLAAEAFQVAVPNWATEGVACYAEKDEARARRIAHAVAMGPIGPLEELTGVTRARMSTMPTDQVSVFYSRALVVFDALVAETGSVEAAMEAASRLERATALEVSSLERTVNERLGSARGAVRIDRPREERDALAVAAYVAIAGLGVLLIVVRLAVNRPR